MRASRLQAEGAGAEADLRARLARLEDERDRLRAELAAAGDAGAAAGQRATADTVGAGRPHRPAAGRARSGAKSQCQASGGGRAARGADRRARGERRRAPTRGDPERRDPRPRDPGIMTPGIVTPAGASPARPGADQPPAERAGLRPGARAARRQARRSAADQRHRSRHRAHPAPARHLPLPPDRRLHPRQHRLGQPASALQGPDRARGLDRAGKAPGRRRPAAPVSAAGPRAARADGQNHLDRERPEAL